MSTSVGQTWRGIWGTPSVTGLAAFALIFAASNVAAFLRAADTIDLGAAIEFGNALEPAYLSQFVSTHLFAATGEECGDAISRARITVATAELRGAESAGDPLPLQIATSQALRAADERLHCAPVDGNAWLQWSNMQSRAGGSVDATAEGLQNSGLFAPSESWVLAPRLDRETQLEAPIPSALELQYTRDLRQFIRFETTGAVAAAYVGHDENVRRRMRALIDAGPADRRKAIAAEIDRLGVDYAKS